MNIEKSVKRFVWRFESKSWKVNENDIDALNEIIDFVNQKQKTQINNHQLFGKLYIYVYSQFLDKYESTVFDDIPRKELHSLLEKPIELFIQNFTNNLNDSERYALFKKLQISTEHPATISDEKNQKDLEHLSNSIQEKENFDRLFGKVWECDVVESLLITQINHFLNMYYGNK